MTNDQASMTNEKGRSYWSLGFGHWSFSRQHCLLKPLISVRIVSNLPPAQTKRRSLARRNKRPPVLGCFELGLPLVRRPTAVLPVSERCSPRLEVAPERPLIRHRLTSLA